MTQYTLPSLKQADIDEIVSEVASDILDNADYHVSRWQETRTKAAGNPANTGLAQAGDLGVDVLPHIAAIAVDAWDWVSAWVVSNRDNIASGVITNVLYEHLKTKTRSLPPQDQDILDAEEREIVNKSICDKIVDRLKNHINDKKGDKDK